MARQKNERDRRTKPALFRLYEKPASAVGTSIFLLFLVLALLGPLFTPYGVNEQIVLHARTPPSRIHWFGTDNLGRDVFSRVVLGAWDVLTLAGLGTLVAVAGGTVLGLLSGYRGGIFDELLMRLFDSLLALPALLLALLLLGIMGPSKSSILIVLVVLYIPIVTRVVRSVVLGVRGKGFVEVARLQGVSLARVLFREILPSVMPTLAVEGALRFSYAIFLVASLGFLGVGVQPPNPNWGLIMKAARSYAFQTPWALYFPAGAISILVIGVNLMVDGLKRVLQSGQRDNE